MNKFWKEIFNPRDGSREKVKGEVLLSRQNVERAVNRFEDTIRELLDENDKLTGRTTYHAKQTPHPK